MRDAAPTEISFEANGVRFAALQWSSDSGPLALCLHGYPDTAWTWRHLGPRLAAEGWRVVAPFMRGYAPSGLAAYGAARLAPERFTRVVTIAVPPPPVLISALRRDPLLALRQARRSWYMGFQQLPGVSERALDRLIPRLWRDWSPGYDAAWDVERVLGALERYGGRTAALSYYRALRRRFPDTRVSASVPLLYVHGRQDGCVLVDVVARGRERFRADARVEVVDGAGHFVQLERPEVVGDLTRAFLGGAGRTDVT